MIRYMFYMDPIVPGILPYLKTKGFTSLKGAFVTTSENRGGLNDSRQSRSRYPSHSCSVGTLYVVGVSI